MKPYKAHWFYGHGPDKEMILDNSQNKIAREYGLSQGVISACLRGERGQHNGWRFVSIENPRYFHAEKKEPVIPDIKPTLQKPSPNSKHMEAAVEAEIRHLMADLYPQWCKVDVDGYIFTG